MTADDPRPPIHRLHESIDAEVERLATAPDLAVFPQSEFQAYVARLLSLHGGVVAMEEYENGLAEA